MSKSGTAKAMQAVEAKVEGYVLGEQTQEHIALFVDALGESASIGAQCVVEAIAVAKGFPMWTRDSAAYKALGKGVIEALKASGMKEGSAKGYATHFSNIVRVAKLPTISYSIGQMKGKKPILKECSGADFFLKRCGNFTDAYHAAKVLAKQYGLTNGKGRTKAAAKPLDAAGIIDALDKVINAARVSVAFDKAFLPTLQKARAIATSKVEQAKDQSRKLSAEASARLRYSKLSRGQKAAATRRANKTKVERVTERVKIIPVRQIAMPVLH